MSGFEHRIWAAVYCHIGGGRSSNEDNYYLDGVWKSLNEQNQNQLLNCSREQPSLFAVCDGMGGQQYGEIASLMAVSLLHRNRNSFLYGDKPAKRGSQLLSQLSRQLWESCQELRCHMGSTIALAMIRENMLYAYGLGDSRIYLMYAGNIQKLTQDHTMAAEAEFMGLRNSPVWPSDPRNHQLTQYFGMDCSEYDAEPSYTSIELKRGQRVLLCSDGLSGYLDDIQLALALECGTPLENVQALVNMALECGAVDNITAMVLEI